MFVVVLVCGCVVVVVCDDAWISVVDGGAVDALVCRCCCCRGFLLMLAFLSLLLFVSSLVLF